jgi:lysyl-tRNA synthetase class 2
VGIELLDQDPDLAKKARAMGNHSCREDDDFETAFFKLMLDYVEPALSKKAACILYDYPASQAALAKVEDNRAKRFEFYIDGIELSNAFFELTSYEENKSRIDESQSKRREIHKKEVFVDKEFLNAMKSGIPDCSGNALGFDRLLALSLGLTDIKAVVPFSNIEPYSIET